MPFLLLHGTEPDYAWERFVAAVGAARGAARRHLGGGPAGDPDAGAAHPAGDRHRARDAPAADRALSRLLGRDADPRQHLGAAGAAAGRGRASTRSAWPRTCRTTWPRPPTRRRRVTLLEHLEQLTGLHLPIETLARGRGDPPHRGRRADRPVQREHRRRRRPGAAVRHVHRRPRGHRPARRRRRGAQRRGDRRRVRAIPRRPGPQAPEGVTGRHQRVVVPSGPRRGPRRRDAAAQLSSGTAPGRGAVRRTAELQRG